MQRDPGTKLSVLTGAAVKPFDPGQIRMIGTPDIADALIDPQRPERMLRYADFDTQPIDAHPYPARRAQDSYQVSQIMTHEPISVCQWT